MHEIRDCTWSRKVWKVLVDPQNWHKFWRSTDVKVWIDMNMNHELGNPELRHRWQYVFRETSYGIWFSWNRKKHNELVPEVPHVFFAKLMVQRVDILMKVHAASVDDVIT